MSVLTLFIIGTIVFSITVYGSVMAGGLYLVGISEAENAVPEPGENVPETVERPSS